MEQAVAIFNKNWSLYRKIIDANYMHHSNFYELTSKEIYKVSQKNTISILDLGCGDSNTFKNLLRDIEIIEYAGYDLSEIALLKASDNLSFLKLKTRFIHGKMQEEIKSELQIFDIIYSSYAIHHLSDIEKTELIENISNKLREGGFFIYIDVFRDQNISRESYIENYINIIDREWESLNEMEKKEVKLHLKNYDFPSSIDFILNTAKINGLENVLIETIDKTHFYLCFTKK